MKKGCNRCLFEYSQFQKGHYLIVWRGVKVRRQLSLSKKISVDRVTILVLCHHTTAVTVILYYQIQGKLWKTYCQLKGWMHEHFNCKKLFLNLNSSNFAYYTLFKLRLGALLTRSVCRSVGPSVCPTKITKLYKSIQNVEKH